ncbi:MAG: HNH endonuclease [Candidatus Obscuribacterales bacterium]
MARDYRKEYDEYHGKPEQKKRRAQRNAARAKAAKRGLVKKGDDKEVDHVGMNRKGPLNNKKVRVISRAKNRRKQPKRSGKDD